MRRPGIEPGAQEWESCMLPLHQRREATSLGKLKYYKRKSYIYVVAAPKSKLRTAVHSALKCAICGCFCYGWNQFGISWKKITVLNRHIYVYIKFCTYYNGIVLFSKHYAQKSRYNLFYFHFHFIEDRSIS